MNVKVLSVDEGSALIMKKYHTHSQREIPFGLSSYEAGVWPYCLGF